MTLRRALVVALLATSLQLAAAKITKVGRSQLSLVPRAILVLQGWAMLTVLWTFSAVLVFVRS